MKSIKKINLILILLSAMLLVSCGGKKQESAWEDNGESVANAEQSKVLIAYFTVAENSEVDAVSSASVTKYNGNNLGMVQAVAAMIQEETDGDLFSLKTSTVYPENIGSVIEVAKEEQNQDARPELTTHIENLDEYDVIFIGFPTWWYDLPQIMYSFFDKYDFSGKTIIPFNVHNGSRFSGTIDTIKELEEGATVLENGFTVSINDVSKAKEDVDSWLKALGY